MIPQADERISEFIISADHALYLAKRKGRNQYQITNNQPTIARAIAE